MICEYGGGDPAMEQLTVDSELEKNRGVSQEAGAVTDHHFAHHSVLIYISCVDYIVTLYCLRRPSRCPPDYTTYLTHKGQRTNI